MTTNTWICDTCGLIVEKPEDGWIEWISFVGKKPGRDLRLVHHKPSSPRGGEAGCQFVQSFEYAKDEGLISDLPLSHFIGPDGLMQLLAMIVDQAVPVSEILEMIKRIHIPGYEHARLHFDRAISEGVFEPNMPKNFYRQSDIEDTIQFAEKEELE